MDPARPKYARNRALQGVLLSVGAPLGWLLFQWIDGSQNLADEIVTDWRLYSYLLISSAIAFTIFGFLLGRMEDRLARDAHRLELLSKTDALTGISNRLAFTEAIERQAAFSSRSGLAFSLVMLDIDRFKSVNDRYGHQAGDEVLKAVARTIASERRREDIVARIGGEEFAVILPGAEQTEARRASERILQNVRRLAIHWEGHTIPVTISAGVAVWHAGGESPRSMMTRADSALYQAKETGRDRVVVSEEDPHEKAA